MMPTQEQQRCPKGAGLGLRMEFLENFMTVKTQIRRFFRNSTRKLDERGWVAS